MSGGSGMKQEWDTRARHPSFRYVDNRARTEEEFQALGLADADAILADVSSTCPRTPRFWRSGAGSAKSSGRWPSVSARCGESTSREMVKQARLRLAHQGNVRIEENSGSDLQGLPGEYFDLCYSCAALRHVPERAIIETYLADAYRILKPGGVLKIEVGGVYANNPFRSLYKGRADSWQGVRFTMPKIGRMVEEARFELVAAYHARFAEHLGYSSAVENSIETQRTLWIVARKAPGMDVWERSGFAAGQALEKRVPAGSRVILTEYGLEDHLVTAGGSHVEFLYLHEPGESADAIESTGRAAGAGWRLPAPSGTASGGWITTRVSRRTSKNATGSWNKRQATCSSTCDELSRMAMIYLISQHYPPETAQELQWHG